MLTDASSAKPGNRSLLIVPSGRMIVAAGNSSRTITTTGPAGSGTVTSPRSPLPPPAISFGGRAGEQEHRDEGDVGDGEVGQQQPPGVRAQCQHDGRRSAGQRHGDHEDDRIDADRAQHGEDEGGPEHGHDDAVDDRSGAPVDQRGDGDRGDADRAAAPG